VYSSDIRGLKAGVGDLGISEHVSGIMLLLNIECRMMKFNSVFHYFDILRFLVRHSAVQNEMRFMVRESYDNSHI
jgi:hypothetical protein